MSFLVKQPASQPASQPSPSSKSSSEPHPQSQWHRPITYRLPHFATRPQTFQQQQREHHAITFLYPRNRKSPIARRPLNDGVPHPLLPIVCVCLSAPLLLFTSTSTSTTATPQKPSPLIPPPLRRERIHFHPDKHDLEPAADPVVRVRLHPQPPLRRPDQPLPALVVVLVLVLVCS